MYTKSDVKNYFFDFLKKNADIYNGKMFDFYQFIENNFYTIPGCKLVRINTLYDIDVFKLVKFVVKIKKTNTHLYTIVIGIQDKQLSPEHSKIIFKKLPVSYDSSESQTPSKHFNYSEYIQKITDEKKAIDLHRLNYSFSKIVKLYFLYRSTDEKDIIKKADFADSVIAHMRRFLFQRNEMKEKKSTKYEDKALVYLLHQAYSNSEIYHITITVSAWNNGQFSSVCTKEVEYILKNQKDYFKKSCISDFYGKTLSPACGTALITMTLTNVLTGESNTEREELKY